MNDEEPVYPQSALKDGGANLGVRPPKGRSKRRVVIFLVVSLFNIGLIVLLASQILSPAQGTASTGGTSPLIGRTAPDFTLPLVGAPPSTPPIHLAALKGKPVLLNFWASWCDACKQEAPLLQKASQQLAPQGVMLIGVDFEDRTDAAKRFFNQYRITYPNVADTVNGVTGINYGVTGVPESFFIDRSGIIVRKEIGALSEQSIQQDLHIIDPSIQWQAKRTMPFNPRLLGRSINTPVFTRRRERSA